MANPTYKKDTDNNLVREQSVISEAVYTRAQLEDRKAQLEIELQSINDLLAECDKLKIK